MRDSTVKRLAICNGSCFLLAAVPGRPVQVWDWEKEQQIAEIQTILDSGGHRLVLAASSRICVAGSWESGLAAYSIPDGKCLWHRRDLIGLHSLRLGHSDQQLYCGVDNGSAFSIEAGIGATIDRMDGVEDVISSRFANHKLVVIGRGKYRIEGERTFVVPPMSFGLIDAVFSPGQLCISEPRSGIRCLQAACGELLWHHPHIGSNHLGFAEDGFFYCVANTNDGGDSSLIRLAPNLLDCDQIVRLGPCWEAKFFESSNFGTLLITMRGALYQVSTGRVVRRLNFPQRDYPDHFMI